MKHVLVGVSQDNPKSLHRYNGRENIPIKGTTNKYFKFEKAYAEIAMVNILKSMIPLLIKQ